MSDYTAADKHPRARDSTSAAATAEDPAEIAAEIAFRQLQAEDAAFAEALARPDAGIVIEVPSTEWVEPASKAWARFTAATPARLVNLQRQHEGGGRSYLQFREGESDVGTANEGVRVARVRGFTVCGVAANPERRLPSDLLRSADFRVLLPPVDARRLEEVAVAVTGARPTMQFQISAPIGAGDLTLAKRVDQTANDYIARVLALAAARVKPPRITLDELHGMGAAAAWGRDLVIDLADYRSGQIAWSDVDRGAVLQGPPGVGKTLFAQALAGSCGVPLITGSFGTWQAAGHLGDMLKSMLATFSSARSAAPCILFIDEIDSFPDRDAGDLEYREYHSKVVNALLEQLDGVGARDGVVVLGACNNASGIDPALLRPGRLERVIPVTRPDPSELAAILRFHLGADLPDADLTRVAQLARGGTGADCAKWVREARRAARRQGRQLRADDIVDVIADKGAQLPACARLVMATHEAGHAVVAMLSEPAFPPEFVVLKAVTAFTEITSPSATATRRELESYLCVLMGGRAAEMEILGSISAGAGGGSDSDLARATCLATRMVSSLGMGSDLTWTPLHGPEQLSASLRDRPDLAFQVTRLLETAQARARLLVLQNRQAVERIAEELMTRGVIDNARLRELIDECRLPTHAAISNR